MAKLGVPETPIRSAAWRASTTRVHIWDASHGACTAVTPPRVDVGDSGHAPSCEHFVVNEDESMPLLALPRSHGAVQLLSLRGHQQAGVLRTGAGTVRALCFGGGTRSTELLTASRDGRCVNVWDVRMNRCVASVNVGQGTSVGCVSSSANGSHFAASLSRGTRRSRCDGRASLRAACGWRRRRRRHATEPERLGGEGFSEWKEARRHNL